MGGKGQPLMFNFGEEWAGWDNWQQDQSDVFLGDLDLEPAPGISPSPPTTFTAPTPGVPPRRGLATKRAPHTPPSQSGPRWFRAEVLCNSDDEDDDQLDLPVPSGDALVCNHEYPMLAASMSHVKKGGREKNQKRRQAKKVKWLRWKDTECNCHDCSDDTGMHEKNVIKPRVEENAEKATNPMTLREQTVAKEVRDVVQYVLDHEGAGVNKLSAWSGLPLGPLTLEEPEMDLPVNSLPQTMSGMVRVKSIMDSGAAESVAPPSMAPGVCIEESPGSRRGQHYISASKTRIPNLGQQTINALTNENQKARVTYQVAEVSRPLTAVGSTCDQGNLVIFSSTGGYVYNLQNGGYTSFDRNGSIYELNLWLKAQDVYGSTTRASSGSFPRQGVA